MRFLYMSFIVHVFYCTCNLLFIELLSMYFIVHVGYRNDEIGEETKKVNPNIEFIKKAKFLYLKTIKFLKRKI